MTPDYYEGPMWECTDARGESQLIPADDFTEKQAREHTRNYPGEDVECVIRHGWWARLSARGYMDATDWMGPYDSEGDAMDALAEQYDVDPITGDDEDEDEGGGSSGGGGVPFTLDGLGQHQIPLEDYDLGDVRVVVWAAQLKPSPSLSIYKVELIRMDTRPNYPHRAVVADQTTLAAPNAFVAAYDAAKFHFKLSTPHLSHLWNTFSPQAHRRGGGAGGGGGVPFVLDGVGSPRRKR
jgi:hypothetical protein